MSSITQLICLFLVCSAVVLHAIPMGEDEYPMVMRKRLSNEALIRLIMRNRGNMMEMKRAARPAKRSDLERRSIDDDFSNCFLSPVQCMLPHSK